MLEFREETINNMNRFNVFDDFSSNFYVGANGVKVLKNAKREFRSRGPWTTAQENEMFAGYVRKMMVDANEKNTPGSMLNFPIPAKNQDYFYDGGLIKLELSYEQLEKMYVYMAYYLTCENERVIDTAFLSDAIDAVNDFIPLEQGKDFQKSANHRADAIYNMCRLFNVPARLFIANNSETGNKSHFVILPGKTQEQGGTTKIDAWQIVNPAAYSIINIGSSKIPYPSRCFISEKQLSELVNAPEEFSIRYDAPADSSNVLSMVDEPERATVVNIGNPDFVVEHLSKYSTEKTHTQDDWHR